MFVATANTMNIPAPLLDRMEVIRLSGYTEDEKIAIAKQYLLPKQMKNNGLKTDELHVAESALRDIVRYYTREAGVRNLERDISKICRKVVKRLLLAAERRQGAQGEGPGRGHREESRQVSRRAPLHLRHRGEEEPGRPGHRTRLDRSRRRSPDHRSGRAAGQGQDHDDRQARRRDERVDRRGAVGGAAPFEGARHPAGLLPEDRPAHPPAGRRDAEGRPVGGRRDRHGDRVDPHRHSGARRRRDDRRDHAARRSAADRRAEGEAACGRPRRNQDGADPRGERQGSGRDSGRDQESPRHPPGALDRAGPRGGARAAAHAAAGDCSRCPRGAAGARPGREARSHQALARARAECAEMRALGMRRPPRQWAGFATEDAREQVRIDRRDREARRHFEGGRRPRARCDRQRDQELAQERRNRDARGLRLVLRRQAHRAAGRNPRTGATIKIRAAKVPKFRAGKALKDAVN